MKYTNLLVFITIILFSAAGLAGCSQDKKVKATADEPKPAQAEPINKLLKNKVGATGIAVPGMPAGAPGTKGKRTAVDVYLFRGQDKEAYYGKY